MFWWRGHNSALPTHRPVTKSGAFLSVDAMSLRHLVLLLLRSFVKCVLLYPPFHPLSVFFLCCVNCFSFVASFLLSCCHFPEFHFNLTVLIDVLHSQNFNCSLFQMTLKHSPPILAFPPEFQAGVSHLLFLLSKRSAAPPHLILRLFPLSLPHWNQAPGQELRTGPPSVSSPPSITSHTESHSSP